MNPPAWELLLIGAGVAVFLIMWRWNRRSSTTATSHSDPLIPPGITIAAQEPLSDRDMYFYNLLCLAVQERYLVLAQVPLWCLVDVQGTEPKGCVRLLGQLAFKRVDFVLVHPGTRAVEAVVQLEQAATDSVKQQRRDRLVDTVLQTAGLKLVKLKVQQPYTVQDLHHLMGVEPME